MPEVLRATGDRISLASVLQLAEMEALSGRVVLPTGQIELHQGNVVAARVGAWSGTEALLEALVHPSGAVVVETAEVAAAPPVGSLATLILEGWRLQDEWRRVDALVLAPAESVALAGPLAPLQPHLDGRRPTRDAVARAKLPRCRVADALVRALEAGQLVERAPADAPHAIGDDETDFHAAVEEGRRCVREGRLEVARTAFERALRHRPDDRIALQNLRRLAALRVNG